MATHRKFRNHPSFIHDGLLPLPDLRLRSPPPALAALRAIAAAAAAEGALACFSFSGTRAVPVGTSDDFAAVPAPDGDAASSLRHY